jgi:NAD(P)-dependent dehydrogenase (short-subunit alcohol dehydrogenase family)
VDRAAGDALESAAAQCAEFGAEVTTVRADVSVEADVTSAIAHAVAEFDSVDILVNNAAILTNCPVAEMSAKMFDETLAVDLRSVFLGCRAVLPTMLAAGYGRIINIASQLALKGGPGLAHYSAAKAGVIGFHQIAGARGRRQRDHRQLHRPGPHRDAHNGLPARRKGRGHPAEPAVTTDRHPGGGGAERGAAGQRTGR